MRCYESTLALHPDLGEAGVQEQMERVRQIIAAHGGSVREVAEWGQRDLAYPIRKQRRAMFQVVVYDGTGRGNRVAANDCDTALPDGLC